MTHTKQSEQDRETLAAWTRAVRQSKRVRWLSSFLNVAILMMLLVIDCLLVLFAVAVVVAYAFWVVS